MSRAVLPKPTVRTFVTPLLFLLVACDNTTNLATRPDRSDGGMDAQVIEGEAGEDSGLVDVIDAGAVIALCGQDMHRCECSDGKDNDGDGDKDGFDSECTGAFDDFEASFRVNTVNEGNPNCADCFYDNNSQSNDDGCEVSTSCIADGTPASQGPCRTCNETPQCRTNCRRITPNGCDCFGCCDVTYNGVTLPVRLEASCTVEQIANPIACRPCTIDVSCMNPCEPCELCPGKRLEDLPTACRGADGSIGYSCGDRRVCALSDDCDGTEHCSQGCCVPILW